MPSAAVFVILVLLPTAVAQDPPQKPAKESAVRPARDDRDQSEDDSYRLQMSKAIACLSIDGYEQFEVLPGASLTKDEKLLVYYRPRNFKTVYENDQYRVHLTQDGQIRRRGEKAVLRRKAKILEYHPKSAEPLEWIYLKNSVPLKGLPPGEYDYDIILRDEYAQGTPVIQTLKFRIVLAELPKEDE